MSPQIMKRRRSTAVTLASVSDHGILSPPPEKRVRMSGADATELPKTLFEQLKARYGPKPPGTAAKNYLRSLPGFDFTNPTVLGDDDLPNEHLHKLENMFKFPKGPRLFSELSDDTAAERARAAVTEFLIKLAVIAADRGSSYPDMHHPEPEKQKEDFYILVATLVGNSYHGNPDWEGPYGNSVGADLVGHLLETLLGGRRPVWEPHPEQGDLGIAADLWVDVWEKKTGRI